MATEILSFGNLQHELEEARSSLKGVDESIKRLIGRDPSEFPPRNVQKRVIDDKSKSLKSSSRQRTITRENEEPPAKRRGHISVFKRLSGKVPDDEQHLPHRGLISKVIVTPKEVPSREQALEAQNKDEKFKARNKRMFGALLGTLQKFQQEETKLKQREQKRAELEKKIEDHEIKEKEDVRKERQELFFNRKKKQAEIKVLELKMLRMKEFASWEQSQKHRLNFITTKSKPHIHYIPRKMTDKTKKLLEDSNKNLQDTIDAKKKQIAEELQHIEEKMKRNFDHKFGIKEEKEKEEVQIGRDSRGRHDNDNENDNDDQLDDTHDSQNEETEHKEETETDQSNTKEKGEEDQVESVDENNKEVEIENSSVDVVANLNEQETSVTEEIPDVNNSEPCENEFPTSENGDPSFSNNDMDVSQVVTNYEYTEFNSDYNMPEYNSQEFQSDEFQNSEFQNNYNNISVQMGNFGPQTSD